MTDDRNPKYPLLPVSEFLRLIKDGTIKPRKQIIKEKRIGIGLERDMAAAQEVGADVSGSGDA